MNRSRNFSSHRFGLGVLLAFVILSAIVFSFRGGGLHLYFDIRQYLDAAYHLAHDHDFTSAQTARPAPPAIGREPGYPLFLATLMIFDPHFARFTPECFKIENSCSDRIYLTASLANLGFILAAGIVMYFVALKVAADVWAGLVAAGYMLFNVQMNKGWADPMSDRFAVLIVCLALLATVWAWQRRRGWAWLWVGLALAILTLTKAVFFPYCVLLFMISGFVFLFVPKARARILVPLTLATVVYATLVGGWAVRNWAVSGQLRLTDLRGGIALSTREVFDHMTPEQYFASFVYWTRGFGNGLARRLFPADVVAPFDLSRPGGFYDRGQNGYGERVRALMKKEGVGRFAAAAQVDRKLEREILEHPLIHLVTTLPLLYRGIWIDEFALLGLPILCWISVRAVRRRDWLLAGLLSIGVFNLAFYATFSLDLPRYQMTAVPAIALAAGVATAIIRRTRAAKLKHGFESIRCSL